MTGIKKLLRSIKHAYLNYRYKLAPWEKMLFAGDSNLKQTGKEFLRYFIELGGAESGFEGLGCRLRCRQDGYAACKIPE